MGGAWAARPAEQVQAEMMCVRVGRPVVESRRGWAGVVAATQNPVQSAGAVCGRRRCGLIRALALLLTALCGGGAGKASLVLGRRRVWLDEANWLLA